MIEDEKVYTFEDYVAAVNVLKAEGLNEEEIERAVRKLLVETPKKRKKGQFKVRKVRGEQDYLVGMGTPIPKGTEHYTWQKNGRTYRSLTLPEGGYLA